MTGQKIAYLMVQLNRRYRMAEAMGCRPETVAMFQAAVWATADIEIRIRDMATGRRGGAS